MPSIKDTPIEALQEKNGRQEITIIKREQKGSFSLYARYYIDKPFRHLNNNRMYVIESLETKVQEDARNRALQRYAELQNFIKTGRSFRSKLVKKVFDEFEQFYEHRVKLEADGYTKHMLRGYKNTVKRYWLEYLAEQGVIHIDDIKYEHLENYPIWRKEYWINDTPQKRLSKHSNVSINPSQTTILWDVKMFRAFLKWAKNHNHMHADVPDYTYRTGTKNSRLGFTKFQWDKLTAHMASDNFLTNGTKHKRDHRVERSRMGLRAFVLLLGHSGMRPGEALKLKWGDVELLDEKGPNGGQLAVANIQATHTKQRKFRRVLINETGVRALLRLRQYKYRTDRISEHDYIFCEPNSDKPIQTMHTVFKQLVQKAGIGTDAKGNEFVPYSCRHFYITMSLQRGIDAYSVAKNCGTSVEMIQQYYDATTPLDYIQKLQQGLPVY